MRNGSLWSGVVFEQEVTFHEFDFQTSSLECEVPKSSIWKHTTSCDKGVLFFHSYLATPTTNQAQIFTGFNYFMHMLRYSKWEAWSLTITKVSPGFKCLVVKDPFIDGCPYLSSLFHPFWRSSNTEWWQTRLNNKR